MDPMEKVAEAIKEHAAAVRLLAEAVMHSGNARNSKLPEFARPPAEAAEADDTVIQAIKRSVDNGGKPEELAGYTVYEVQRIAATQGFFSNKVGAYTLSGTGPSLNEHWSLQLL